MNSNEKRLALRAYCDALGITSEKIDFALPYLIGEKNLPTTAEAAIAANEACVAEAKTITLTQAGKIGGCSRSTIWRMTKDGTLAVVPIRGKNRVRLADVLRVFKGKAA